MCKKGPATGAKASKLPEWAVVSTTTSISKPKRDPTAYELRVYKLCVLIPKGKVSTYGEMAKALHSSARAVGQAMRRNPYAPRVPCHRVVATGLNIGGFSGSWGPTCANVQRKRALLEGEGVKFTQDHKVVSKAYVVMADELEKLLTSSK